MTDEKRQKLINSLRKYQGYDRELTKLVHQAADELEQLSDTLKIADRACASLRDELRLVTKIDWNTP